MNCAISFICFTFLAGSIEAYVKSRIIGGEDVEIKYYPYHASLHRLGKYICGGAIVGDSHILTAAHCVREDTPPYLDLTVNTGTSSSKSNQKAHRVKSVKLHPKWTGCWDTSCNHDVAVITLTGRICFDGLQQMIRLASHDVVSGAKATLSGWGHTTVKNGIFSEQLQKLQMSLLTHTECQPRHPTIKIHKEQLCAFRKKGQGACMGDSGSPLIVGTELVGIVSWIADGDCAGGIPEVFANVYAYRDFITSEIST